MQKEKVVNAGDLSDILTRQDNILARVKIYEDKDFFDTTSLESIRKYINSINCRLTKILDRVQQIEINLNEKNQQKMFFYNDVKE